MPAFTESTIDAYRKRLEAGDRCGALEIADNAFALVALDYDMMELRNTAAEFANDFFAGDPEARNDAVDRFTALAFRVLATKTTPQGYRDEIAEMGVRVWQGGRKWSR